MKVKLVKNLPNGEKKMILMNKIGINGQKKIMQNNVQSVVFGLFAQLVVIKCNYSLRFCKYNKYLFLISRLCKSCEFSFCWLCLQECIVVCYFIIYFFITSINFMCSQIIINLENVKVNGLKKQI